MPLTSERADAVSSSLPLSHPSRLVQCCARPSYGQDPAKCQFRDSGSRPVEDVNRKTSSVANYLQEEMSPHTSTLSLCKHAGRAVGRAGGRALIWGGEWASN